MIKNLIEDNKQILNKMNIQELKTDLLKHANIGYLDESLYKRDKSKLKGFERIEGVEAYEKHMSRLETDICHSTIVHKKKLTMMMNQAERLTRSIVAEEKHQALLTDHLKEYFNKDYERKRKRDQRVYTAITYRNKTEVIK